MKKNNQKEPVDPAERFHPAPSKCPKCGGELKPMRCRIDKPERYCTVCRLTVEPRG